MFNESIWRSTAFGASCLWKINVNNIKFAAMQLRRVQLCRTKSLTCANFKECKKSRLDIVLKRKLEDCIVGFLIY